jgi:hypothetical protein
MPRGRSGDRVGRVIDRLCYMLRGVDLLRPDWREVQVRARHAAGRDEAQIAQWRQGPGAS